MPVQVDFNRKRTNLDRFRPNGHRPVTPLFYDMTYDSEAPTIHMNGPKCRLSVLGRAFCVVVSSVISTCIRFQDNWPTYYLRDSFQTLTTIYIAHFEPKRPFSIDITYFEPKRPVFNLFQFRHPTTQPILKTNLDFPL